MAKRSSVEVMDWITQNRTLARLAQNTEKQCNIETNLKHADLDVAQLKEDKTLQDRDRNDYVNYVYGHLAHLKEMSQRTQTLLQSLTTENKQKLEDAEKLQRLMEKLQSGIVSFKSKMRKDFEDTMMEERELSRDIMTVNERYIVNLKKDDEDSDSDDDGYLDQIPRRPRKNIKKGGVEDLRREIEDINKEIEEEGGLFGGWHSQEHEFFLALWTQVIGANKRIPEQGSPHFRKSIAMLRERGVSGVPSRTPDELERHALWYFNFLRRGERKKETLEKWKKLRADHEADLTDHDDSGLVKETVSRISSQSSQVSQDKRKAVSEWRAKKAQESILLEQEKAKREAGKAEEAARNRAMQRSKQEAVALYRLEKEQRALHEAQVKAALEANSDSHKFSAAELRERRKVDVINARRRREEVVAKKMASEQRAHALEGAGRKKREEVNERVQRDPSRAMKNTHASLQHAITGNDLDNIYDQRTAKGAHGAPVAMGAYDLKRGGTRAVPSWRKGL